MIARFASWSRGCLTMQGYGDLSDGERRSLWLREDAEDLVQDTYASVLARPRWPS
jgi:hypothetical protein